MQFILKTEVPGNYKEVYAHFDRDLLEKLTPPLMHVEIKQFDGSKDGDEIRLINSVMGIVRQEWHNRIVEHGENERQCWFVDEGLQMPAGFTFWRHRHIVRKLTENTAVIIDDITFETAPGLLEWMLFVPLYSVFAFRKPVYKKYFQALANQQIAGRSA